MRAPPLTHRPEVVIFDMDGLLLDTEPLAVRAWLDAASALDVAFDEVLALAMTGRNFHDCSRLVRERYAADYPVEALLGSWHATYDGIVAREGIAVKPGARELLAWLEEEGIARAVATSTLRERAKSKLQGSALLEHFSVLVGGDEVARGKPAPDIHLEAARRLGAPPHACLVLEDSVPGVSGALAAGMAAIMVPDLHPPSPALLAANVLVLDSLHVVRAHLHSLAV